MRTAHAALGALAFAVLAALGLALGFGITAANQDGELARTGTLVDQSFVSVQANALQNAEQDALLFELALNGTDPVPTLTVLLTGTYIFYTELDTVGSIEDVPFRIVRVETLTSEYVMLEVDVPLLPPIPITNINNLLFSWYAFEPTPYLGLQSSDVFAVFSRRNLEKFSVSSGCLGTGECFFAGNTGLDIQVNSFSVNRAAASFYYETYLVGPESVLLGHTITFSGPLQFLLPMF